MPDSTRIFIARTNIDHYKRLLDIIGNESARAVIEQLLKEARAELGAAEAEDELAMANSPIDFERVRRWRFKAEEYRATADICQNEAARENYLRLAMNYEQLADQSERPRAAAKRARD